MNLTPYADVRFQIHDGDVLLFRQSRAWYSRLIAVAGRSEYSHVGMAGWWNGNLMCLEMDWSGGRAIMLSEAVKKRQIDVFRADFPLLMRSTVANMARFCGTPYGKWPLCKVALVHLPIVRLFAKPDTNDKANGGPLFCSAAVSRAYRQAGMDLVPHLADSATEPGDLARSALLKYVFTI